MKDTTLIIGNRYWLDDTKETSGIYCGKDDVLQGVKFNDIEGITNWYIVSDDGFVRFSEGEGYHPHYDNEPVTK